MTDDKHKYDSTHIVLTLQCWGPNPRKQPIGQYRYFRSYIVHSVHIDTVAFWAVDEAATSEDCLTTSEIYINLDHVANNRAAIQHSSYGRGFQAKEQVKQHVTVTLRSIEDMRMVLSTIPQNYESIDSDGSELPLEVD